MHGKLDPLVEVNMDPKQFVEVLVTHGKKSNLRQIDLHWAVSDLKQCMAEWYGVPP